MADGAEGATAQTPESITIDQVVKWSGIKKDEILAFRDDGDGVNIVTIDGKKTRVSKNAKK